MLLAISQADGSAIIALIINVLSIILLALTANYLGQIRDILRDLKKARETPPPQHFTRRF